jgi:hypothetical protein
MNCPNCIESEKKKCKICGQFKIISDFYIADKKRNYRHTVCKYCQLARQKQLRIDQPVRMRSYGRKWKKNHPVEVQKLAKKYYANHSGAIKDYNRKWRIEHPALMRELHEKWKRDNPDKWKTIVIKGSIKKLSTPIGKLNSNISRAVRSSLRNNSKSGRRWEFLVGYTVDELRNHLSRLFQPGMTWENYGNHGWHIDHIIPVSRFNFETPEDLDFKRCWGLNNLQPLWAKENRMKRDKLNKPFQPALTIRG